MTPENEKRTPVYNWETEDFEVDARGRVVTVTGGEAVAQIAVKALNTVRGVFLIYANVDDEDLDHKYGNDTQDIMTQGDLPEEARLSEIKRAIEEALIYDPWITAVNDLTLKRKGAAGSYGEEADHLKGDEVEASLNLSTIFDENVDLQGVIL